MACLQLSCFQGILQAATAATSSPVDDQIQQPPAVHVEDDPAEQQPTVDDYAVARANQHWFFSWDQVCTQEKEKPKEPLVVRAMSGAEVVSLSPRSGEQAASLKQRICEKEGTAVFMQQLVQGGKVLDARDTVGHEEPLVLVRMPRKRMLLCSSHFDLCPYDMETGASMRMISAKSLRVSCVLPDWENARCFTGSADGAVMCWDVYTMECLGSLQGMQGAVSSLASDCISRLIAVSRRGTLRVWHFAEKASRGVDAKSSDEWEIDVSGKVQVNVNWEALTALVCGVDDRLQPTVACYDLQGGKCKLLWSCPIPGTSPVLLADWSKKLCMIAPAHQFLELRGIGTHGSACSTIRQFAHERLHRSGLVRADWASMRVVFVAEPFALELWSLETCQMLLTLRDDSGYNADIICLDVDWSQTDPRAITCRTLIDWEWVVGEVTIQKWDLHEDGDYDKVVAAHPMIGGFDIVCATGQF